jgi:hypothetical protein
MTGAKLFGASVVADEKYEQWWPWDGVNWWEADFSPGDLYVVYGDVDRTKASLALLHKKYVEKHGSTLSEHESRIHPSVSELLATDTRN